MEFPKQAPRPRRANLSIRATVSQHWLTFQYGLFPRLAEELGPLSERHKSLVQVQQVVGVDERLPDRCAGGRGSCRRYRSSPPKWAAHSSMSRRRSQSSDRV